MTSLFPSSLPLTVLGCTQTAAVIGWDGWAELWWAQEAALAPLAPDVPVLPPPSQWLSLTSQQDTNRAVEWQPATFFFLFYKAGWPTDSQARECYATQRDGL